MPQAKSYVNIEDFGASPAKSRPENTAAIQKATNSLQSTGGVVFIPAGRYKTNDTLRFHSSIVFQGANVGASIIDNNTRGPVFAADGPERRFHVYFRDIQITNTDKPEYSTHGSTGIDFTNVSQSGVNTVKIEYMTIGIQVEGNPGAAHYLDFYSPLISSCYIGIRCRDLGDGSANETHVFGGRIAAVTTGIELKGINNFQVTSTALESFGIGVDIQDAVRGTKIIGCRFEPVYEPTNDDVKAIRVAKNASETLIMGPYFENFGPRQTVQDHSGKAKIVDAQ